MLQRIIIKECLVKGIYFAPLNHSHNNYSYWCLFKNVNFARIKVPENVRIKLLFWSILFGLQLWQNCDGLSTILFNVFCCNSVYGCLNLNAPQEPSFERLDCPEIIVVNCHQHHLEALYHHHHYTLHLNLGHDSDDNDHSDHPPEKIIIFYLIVLGSPSPCEERSHLRVNQS